MSPPILEAAFLRIVAGREAAFETAFRQAQELLAATPGYLGHELQRCLEHEGRYLLLVRWTDVEAHETGFRGSDRYGPWKRALHGFYDPFPEVLHYERVAGEGI
jgi:heme-degrading monooxygenase HmoA